MRFPWWKRDIRPEGRVEEVELSPKTGNWSVTLSWFNWRIISNERWEPAILTMDEFTEIAISEAPPHLQRLAALYKIRHNKG